MGGCVVPASAEVARGWAASESARDSVAAAVAHAARAHAKDTVPCEVAHFATLVANVDATAAAARKLDVHASSADFCVVKVADGILGITLIFEGHERKVSLVITPAERSKLAERILGGDEQRTEGEREERQYE